MIQQPESHDDDELAANSNFGALCADIPVEEVGIVMKALKAIADAAKLVGLTVTIMVGDLAVSMAPLALQGRRAAVIALTAVASSPIYADLCYCAGRFLGSLA